MRITQCSSSSIDTFSSCEFKYWLQYIIGLKFPSGKAATLGTIVHQVAEWMARLKKRGKINIDPIWLFERAWEENTHIELRKFTNRGLSADYKKCQESINKIISGSYNPYGLDPIDIEKWFEIELPGEEWITIENKPFKIRGFIDLINKIDKDTIEIIDYKNGVQKEFFTFKDINFDNIINKIQGRIYHLAASILYPQYSNILITFYYINHDILTFSLGDEDIPDTLAMLYNFFSMVKKNTLIRRNRSWKCKSCSFNKNDKCTAIWSDLNTSGEQFVKDKYATIN